MGWTDRLLRVVMTAAHGLLRLGWLIRRPRTFGAHALALTPERRIILVRLRYAPGWRLPGGGHGPNEDPRDAVLRELREEIGMTGHGRVRLAAELEERPHFKHDLASLLIVEDVRYQPKWTWEVEQVIEVDPDALPLDVSGPTLRWLGALGGKY